MAKKVVAFNPSQDELMKKLRQKLNENEFVDAVLLYNRIDQREFPESNFLMARCYEMLEKEFYCVDKLLMCLANENFVNYNIPGAIAKVSVFFYSYLGCDVAQDYLLKLKSNHIESPEIQSMQISKRVKQQNKIHFVEDDVFGDALINYKNGKLNEVSKSLQKVDKRTPQYFKAQILLSIVAISEKRFSDAREILLSLIDEGYESEDLIINLYRISIFSEEDKNIIIKHLESENLKTKFSSLAVRAIIFADNEEYEKAIELLEKLPKPGREKEEYLELLAGCYKKKDRIEDLKTVLNKLAVLYPHNFMARYYFLKLENNEMIEGELDFNRVNSATKRELKKYIKALTKTPNYFDGASREQAVYLSQMVLRLGDYNLTKEIMHKIFNSINKDVVLNLLYSTATSGINLQLIFQVLAENLYEEDFITLKDGCLKKVKLKFPSCFYEMGDDSDKFFYLLTAYAQSYSLLYYLSVDVENLANDLSFILDKLFKENLLETEHLNYVQNIVYMLSSYYAPTSDAVKESFKSMPENIRNDLDDYLIKILK